ncbi:hypothetical protein BSNK01_10840 [Bacillaceae bacterium]
MVFYMDKQIYGQAKTFDKGRDDLYNNNENHYHEDVYSHLCILNPWLDPMRL